MPATGSAPRFTTESARARRIPGSRAASCERPPRRVDCALCSRSRRPRRVAAAFALVSSACSAPRSAERSTSCSCSASIAGAARRSIFPQICGGFALLASPSSPSLRASSYARSTTPSRISRSRSSRPSRSSSAPSSSSAHSTGSLSRGAQEKARPATRQERARTRARRPVACGRTHVAGDRAPAALQHWLRATRPRSGSAEIGCTPCDVAPVEERRPAHDCRNRWFTAVARVDDARRRARGAGPRSDRAGARVAACSASPRRRAW